MTLSASMSLDAFSSRVKRMGSGLPAFPSLLTLAVGLLLLLQPCAGLVAALLRGLPPGAALSRISASSIARDILARVTVLAFFAMSTFPASAATIPGANGAGVPEVGRQFFYQDHRDSTALVLNDQAAVLARVEYAPYGEIHQGGSTGTDNFRPKFTGKEFERDIGLYYYGARYMDPATGRFISADPVREFASPYIYAANDPLLYIDPTGESVLAAAFIVGTGLAYGYFAASKNGGTFNPAHWDWTSGSTYSKLILGFVRGAVSAYGLTATVAGYQTAKAAALAAGKKVGKTALITTVLIVSTEIGLEFLNLVSLKFDLEWLSKLTFGLQLGLVAFNLGSLFDLHRFIWNLPYMNFQLPKISNPFSFNFQANFFGKIPGFRLPNANLNIPLPKLGLPNLEAPPELKGSKLGGADSPGSTLSIPKVPDLAPVAGAVASAVAGAAGYYTMGGLGAIGGLSAGGALGWMATRQMIAYLKSNPTQARAWFDWGKSWLDWGKSMIGY
jgi:RHS repeat-associated protein